MSTPNEFAGVCIRCGERVDAGEGTYRATASEDLRMWPQHNRRKAIVEHAECHEQFKGTDAHHLYSPREIAT